jgi:phenylacetate-coenzyme A ligase PaaK-like adenylate-forming protein
VLDTIDALDTLVIQIEPRTDVPPSQHEALRMRFTLDCKRALSITPLVEIAAPDSLPRFEMKAKRFKDVRSQVTEGASV